MIGARCSFTSASLVDCLCLPFTPVTLAVCLAQNKAITADVLREGGDTWLSVLVKGLRLEAFVASCSDNGLNSWPHLDHIQVPLHVGKLCVLQHLAEAWGYLKWLFFFILMRNLTHNCLRLLLHCLDLNCARQASLHIRDLAPRTVKLLKMLPTKGNARTSLASSVMNSAMHAADT